MNVCFEEMNKRITALFDREHQIGHTYLLAVVHDMEELSYVFQNKIFPLLQEYFFDDWSKIRFVLKRERFCHRANMPVNLFTGPWNQAKEDRMIYNRLPHHCPGWKDTEGISRRYTKRDKCRMMSATADARYPHGQGIRAPRL